MQYPRRKNLHLTEKTEKGPIILPGIHRNMKKRGKPPVSSPKNSSEMPNESADA